jgi:hypothetical protein
MMDGWATQLRNAMLIAAPFSIIEGVVSLRDKILDIAVDGHHILRSVLMGNGVPCAFNNMVETCILRISAALLLFDS